MVAFASVMLVAFCSIGTHQAHAQNDPEPWTGTVEVSPATLTLRPGQTLSYRIRLTEQPTADGWWVRLFVDGEVRADGAYEGFSWVPSVGWGFDRDNWDQWRGINIRTADDLEAGTQVVFTHEVWDHTAECPVHNASPVRVNVIHNSPQPSLPEMNIDDVTLSEDGGSAAFRVHLSKQSNVTVTVAYATEAGTAEEGSDYMRMRGTLVFQPGEREKTLPVPVLEDSEDEDDETFKMSLSNVVNATLGDREGTAIINDNDGTDPPVLDIGDVTVAEDGGDAAFRVTLSRESTSTVTVAYETEDGTADVGTDYTGTNGTLTFQPGETERTIEVLVLEDIEDEDNETFTVNLSSAVDARLGDGEGTATITDNDGNSPPPPPPPPPLGLPELDIYDVTVAEDGGNAAFRVTLSRQSTSTVTVAYETEDGTADVGTDYTGTNGTLTFQPGETERTIEVPVLDDGDDEDNETFTVNLSGAVNARLDDGEGRATITDNDGDSRPPGLPKLAINDVTVSEDVGSAVFSVRLSGESTAAVTVAYATADGTATTVADYTAVSGTLTLLPGDSVQALAVPVVDDGEEEVNETFTVRLSGVRNATLLDGDGRATIIDDDGEDTSPSDLPTLAIDDVTVTEDAGTALFSVRLSGESTAAVTVAYATADGTATVGADYTAVGGTLTFLTGDSVQALAVPVVDDGEEEEDETFTVSLSGVRNATLLDGDGRATIIDDDGDDDDGDGDGDDGDGDDGDGDDGDGDDGDGDGDGTPPPSGQPALAIDDVAMAEDEGSAVFTVSLSEASATAVTVAYATSNGTATAGSDYTAAGGTLTFQPGETEHSLSVPVLEDSEEEENETFTVNLSDATNATLADGEGIATIRDNDFSGITVSFGAASYTVQEGGSVAVEVDLSASPGRPVTIPLLHAPDGGAGGQDYSGVPDSVRFDSFETRKRFDVSAAEDEESDDGERVILGFGTLPPGVRAEAPERSVVIIGDVPATTGRVPTDWLREFARTATSQVVDALDERMRCAPDRRSAEEAPVAQTLRWRCARYPGPASIVSNGRRLQVHGDGGLSASEVVAGNSFHVASAAQQLEPSVSLWGRGSFARFERQEHGPVLDGDVRSATLGADFVADPVLVGIALSHSQGDGTVSLDGVTGRVASSLTGLHPYLRLGVHERLALWATVGLGSGTMTVTMQDAGPDETGISTRAGAAGAVVEILSPTEEHAISVALKADALLLRIVTDESASLAATAAEATRVRLMVEGAYELFFAEGEWIAPFVDVGVRHDAGDAERALGVEVGGGLRYAHSALHLTGELEARALLAQAAGGVDRWSVSGSVRFDPFPDSELGPYFTFSSSRGAGELAAVAGPLADTGAATAWNIATELGYGVAVLDGSATGTPWVGVSLSEGTPEYRLGYRLEVDSDLHLGIVGTLRDSTTANEPREYQVVLLLTLR